jgi:sugar phosphate isomerase/epimerase
MRLAISNIAWDAAEDEAVAALLKRFSIDAIDVAPSKYFPSLADATDDDIAQVKAWWAGRGVEITGMQALLFGTTGFNVFGNADCQAALLEHLTAVCRIGAGLGATRLVFGSPKNRNRAGLDDESALSVAVKFFRQLGDIAQIHGVTICLEPNPTCYGANFMTTSEETAEVVTAVAHPSVRMQLDTGAIVINKEDSFSVLRNFAPLIGHIHASEPQLLPIGDGAADHQGLATAISKYLPAHVVTIEMVATANESHLVSIERALKVATKIYGAPYTEESL